MATREPDFSKLTILVVDDQEYIRKLVCQLIRRLGCETILEASDGAEALSLLARGTPDMILCDIKMQPVDGLEFLRKVRAAESGVRDPQVPIVFLTSDSDRGTVVAAMKSEVDGYLVKPVSPADLKAKIVAVLGKRTASRVTW
jgi:two-component system chemotaxis response regulator CheY